MTVTLREYQQRLVDEARQAFRRNRRVLMQAPTGAGKTVMFSYLAQSAVARGTRTCILVHRRELLSQASAKLAAFDVEHGIIDAQNRGVFRGQIAVASIDTLARRLEHYQGAFDLLIPDEAHHAVSPTWARVLGTYPEAKILGVTATPERLDGRGLGEQFDEMIVGPSSRDLINLGHLADYIAYAPAHGPDLSGVHTEMGDFSIRELAERMTSAKLIGDVVEHYRRYAHGLPFVAFCVNVHHANVVADQFLDAGYRVLPIDGSLAKDERDRLLAGLADGSLDGLTSCNLISEGLDIPGISCAILLRPTQSLALYLQQPGRALRPKPDGSKAIILDHAGNMERHGPICVPREWKLDAVPRRKRKSAASFSITCCPECLANLPSGTAKCPHCGALLRQETPLPETVDGELVQVQHLFYDRTGRPTVEKNKEDIDRAVARCRTMKDLRDLARALGFKPGWALHRAKAMGWMPIVNAAGFAYNYIRRSAA